MIINLKLSFQETWGFAILQVLIPTAFLLGIILLSYKIIKNIFQSLTNRPNSYSDISLPKENPPANSLRLALSLHDEIRYINYNEIVRCEADNSYTIFHLANTEGILVSKPLKEYSEILKPNGFLRTHQSHLINPKYVKSWLKEDGGILLLTSGEKIPVSKPNKDTVKQALQQH